MPLLPNCVLGEKDTSFIKLIFTTKKKIHIANCSVIYRSACFRYLLYGFPDFIRTLKNQSTALNHILEHVHVHFGFNARHFLQNYFFFLISKDNKFITYYVLSKDYNFISTRRYKRNIHSKKEFILKLKRIRYDVHRLHIIHNTPIHFFLKLRIICHQAQSLWIPLYYMRKS